MKKFVLLLSWILLLNLYSPNMVSASDMNTGSESDTTVTDTQNPLGLTAQSAVLMDAETGTVLYNWNGDIQLRPASITKIMTLLLIFEALDAGKFSLSDTVTVSEYAASMGGSQVFLEAGETQTVETMIKCISVASANDAAVAMAEFVAGSEAEFVQKMNEKAAQLGMNHTTFINCCGLDTDGHFSSAYDVALMSRELITKHPEIFNYSTIWQENITHVTAKGSTDFTLTNTNKLIRQYEYANGLKTGSTSLAKYCVSATAKKDGLQLIAVIMAAPDYKVRFSEATTLLNYGFANYTLYTDDSPPVLSPLPVTKGLSSSVSLTYADTFQALVEGTESQNQITATLKLPESVSAPVYEGDTIGYLVYESQGKELGRVAVLAKEAVEQAHLKDYFYQILQKYF